MEDQIVQTEVSQPAQTQSAGYSSQPKTKNNGSKWIIIFIVLLVLGGAGIFFFTSSANKPIATPTPSFGVVPIDDKTNPTTVAIPTKSPEPVVKTDVSIEIQNGTGIPGEAKLLSDKLKSLGYSDITAGNAPTTDNTETTVTFLKTLSQSAQDELKKELESFYKTVNVKTSSTQKSDVVVVTGLRGTQTSKPAGSATPKASAAATSSASPKASATPAN